VNADRLLTLLIALALGGCASSRQAEAPRLAQDAGWRWQIVSAGPFDLAAASSRRSGGDTLTAYLEGDGLAYARPNQPALDPTPADPLALRLALADPGSGPVAWIARPCQYTLPEHGRGCRSEAWLARRYAPEVLDSIGAALDALVRASGARHIVLVGYSGGGALAVLLASRRTDVTRIVTVAANLDLGYWIRRDALSPLSGSHDPADAAGRVQDIPQVHFAGSDDRIVGPDVVRAYLAHLPAGAPARLIEIPGFNHDCCWARDWPSLMTRAQPPP
jgi:pimeloyl-ACP methyl ester carboxylesterase